MVFIITLRSLDFIGVEEEGPNAGDAVRGGRQRPPSMESGTTLSAECFEPNKKTFTKLTW